MGHEIALTLDLLEQGTWGFRFRLTAINHATVRLLLPIPEIIGLRFVDATTRREAEWGTSMLVSSRGRAFTLRPGESNPFEFRVRPRGVPRPGSMADDFDYYRWCVDVSAGGYRVSYRWRLDESFFDPDSHWRLPQLQREAEREQATVWLGEVESNSVAVVMHSS